LARLYQHFILCLFFVGLCSLSACKSYPTCPDRLQAVKVQIVPLWNTIKNQKNPKMLGHWIEQFLTQLLGDDYQLRDAGDHYMIVRDDTSTDSLCRADVKTQQRDLNDPRFLYTLHHIVKQHNVTIRRSFLFDEKGAVTKVVQGDTHTAGGNCRKKKYRVDFAYWKAISGKYDQKSWGEACALGKRLREWGPCLKPKMKVLLEQRMKIICKAR